MTMLLEPYPVVDVYCDGISHMENLGSVFRTVYFTWSRSNPERPEKLVVAKIVRPISSLLTPDKLRRMIDQEPILGMLPERLMVRNGEHH